jgi:hypothetical protein
MKKLFVVLFVMATGVLSVSAQDAATASGPIMSKRGYAILPEAGDWSISFNAIPVLNYVGNAFNSSGNTISAGFPSSQTITVRKFNDANNAYRGMLRFDLGSSANKFNVQNDVALAADPTSTATVEDKQSVKNSDIVIGAGIEKRKGISRVQGIYGAMAFINFGRGSNGTQKYTYGNAITSANQNPTFHNFGSNDLGGGSRVTKSTTSNGFGIGVLGFVGAEYFVAPKLSVGAEFQWGPSIQMNGKSTVESEAWDGVNNAVKTTTTETAGNSSMGFNTGVTSINLNFFF